jgi:hypothetical protein
MSNILSVPAPLSVHQLAELKSAQSDEQTVFAAGTAYQRSRAIAYLNRHKFVVSVSVEALAYHVEKQMDYKVDGLRLTGEERDFQVCAMGILQLDVLRETEKAAKADQNNRINDLRRALQGLAHFADELLIMTDEEFIAWFAEKGGVDGIHREFRAANPVEAEPERNDKAIKSAIDGMIANTSAVEVDNISGETGVRLFVARAEGDKLRMVPLDANPDFIASLSDRTPDPMTNAPSRVVAFRELLVTASRIIPDAMSDIPKRPLRAGEKVSDSTVMLPANQIICVRDGMFSVAASRVEDTMILEADPQDEVLRRYLVSEGFIDTMTRKNMLTKLEPTTSAAGLTGVVIADAESKNGPEVRISFERGTGKVDGQLIVKSMNRMGGVFTWRVKAFHPTAVAHMGAAERQAISSRFLKQVVKSREDLAISVAISSKGIGLQLGAAKVETFAVDEVGGDETVRVPKADFLRALNGLLALPLEDDLVWSIDKNSWLRIQAYTASATYRVFIQTLRKEKDPKLQVRERALLERVSRTESADLSAAAA